MVSAIGHHVKSRKKAGIQKESRLHMLRYRAEQSQTGSNLTRRNAIGGYRTVRKAVASSAHGIGGWPPCQEKTAEPRGLCRKNETKRRFTQANATLPHGTERYAAVWESCSQLLFQDKLSHFPNRPIECHASPVRLLEPDRE